MGKKKDKLSTLNPAFKKRIEELFDVITESFSDLYETATHDEKTGLYNNKFFETILDMEIEKAKRGQEKLSMIITDIDFFKKINDTYGHMKGDEILKCLAQIIKKQIRKSDIATRFGGDEFIILLPETDQKKAISISNRLKQAVSSNQLLKKYNLHMSYGVTEYKKNDTKRKFKERADKALYQAKNTGRGSIVFLK